MQVFARAPDEVGHLLQPLDDPEADEGQPLRLVMEEFSRPAPRLEVDSGGGACGGTWRRPRAARRRHRRRTASLLIDGRDVMGGVAGVEGRARARGGRRRRRSSPAPGWFAEQRVEPVAVDAASACNQPLRSTTVGRPISLTCTWIAGLSRTSSPAAPRGRDRCREEQVTKLRSVHLLPQPLVAGRGSGVEERRAVLGLEQVDADDAPPPWWSR